MSTTVGSVTLDEDMAWTDEYKHPLVSASVEPTLGGGVYIQEFVRYEVGRPITLESTENFGFQPFAQASHSGPPACTWNNHRPSHTAFAQ